MIRDKRSHVIDCIKKDSLDIYGDVLYNGILTKMRKNYLSRIPRFKLFLLHRKYFEFIKIYDTCMEETITHFIFVFKRDVKMLYNIYITFSIKMIKRISIFLILKYRSVLNNGINNGKKGKKKGENRK